MEALQTGDIITARVTNSLLFHIGIVVIDGDQVYIYHNTPKEKNQFGGGVVRETLPDWLKSRTFHSLEHTTMSREYIEQKSNQVLEKPFNIFTWNCEHYVYWMKDNKAQSPQLSQWGVVTFLGSLLLTNLKS